MNYPVAVIIPVYKNDTPQYVRPAIDSIIKQTYSCRIYIGVDGPIGNSLNSCLEAYEITKRIDCTFCRESGTRLRLKRSAPNMFRQRLRIHRPYGCRRYLVAGSHRKTDLFSE